MNKILLSVLVFFYTILAAQNSKPYIPQQKNIQAHYPKVPINNAKSSGCWIPLDGSYTDITNLFTQSYSPQDDGSYGPLNLGFNFTFYGQTYNSIYINVNGNITFGNYYTSYSPSGFPSGSAPAMIAPFWADVDLRGTGSGSNKVYYKLESNRIIIQWIEVGYYNKKTVPLNTFQLILTDGTDPDVGIGFNTRFAYDDMNWCVGDVGGTNGFGNNNFATVGAQTSGGSNYYQIGLFGEDNYNYDGAGGNLDGVHFLDGKCFTMDLSGTNVAPIAVGFPDNQTVNMCMNSTYTLTTGFSGPESNQTVTTTITNNTLSNLQTSISNGNYSSQTITINASASDVGTHTITYTAVDNGTPSKTTTVNLTVNVYDCGNFIGPSSIEFDGVDDYVLFGNIGNLNLSGHITLETWIKPYTQNFAGDIAVIHKNDQYMLGYNGSSNKAVFKVNIGGTWYSISSNATLTTNKWSHVAGTFDNNVMKLYINGKLDNSSNVSGALNVSNSNFVVGADLTASKYFAGRLDEIRIWRVAKSENDINLNRFKNIPSNTNYLQMYLKCDEDEGAVLIDTSGYYNNGSLTNMDTVSCWKDNFAKIWYGTTDNNFNTGSNWSKGLAPLVSDNGSLEASEYVIIPNNLVNYPALTEQTEVNNLVINDSANITLNPGAELIIYNDLYNFGADTFDATIRFSGQNTQNIYGSATFNNVTIDADVTLNNDINIRGELLLNTGILNINNQILTIKSDSLKTGLIYHNSGSINGEVTMERYIDHQVNTFGYHYLSSPMTNINISQINDDIPLINLGGNTTSNPLPNLWYYDETVADTNFMGGWTSPGSMSYPMTPMQGFAIYVWNSKLWDVTGTVNNGTISRNVYNTSSGNALADGWNFVGNPYPSPMNWDNVTLPSGVDNAVYYWDYETNQYASYVDGIGTNGGNGYIATMQGFYVHATANTTLTFDNSARTTQNNNSYYRTGNNGNSYPETIKLKVDGNGYTDETAIRFGSNATDSFDVAIDAYKLLSGNPNAPILYTLIQDKKSSINSLPEFNNGSYTVPLYFEPGISGTYTIDLSYKGEFDANTTITLEDAVTGTYHDVIYGGPYQFSMNVGESPNRFFVHFNKVITGINNTENSNLSVYSFDDNICITQLKQNALVEVMDITGKIVLSVQLMPNSRKIIHLPENTSTGIYFVRIQTENQNLVKKLWLENKENK
jgi:hypothetical protein